MITWGAFYAFGCRWAAGGDLLRYYLLLSQLGLLDAVIGFRTAVDISWRAEEICVRRMAKYGGLFNAYFTSTVLVHVGSFVMDERSRLCWYIPYADVMVVYLIRPVGEGRGRRLAENVQRGFAEAVYIVQGQVLIDIKRWLTYPTYLRHR